VTAGKPKKLPLDAAGVRLKRGDWVESTANLDEDACHKGRVVEIVRGVCIDIEHVRGCCERSAHAKDSVTRSAARLWRKESPGDRQEQA
jgi:hypothetical protein